MTFSAHVYCIFYHTVFLWELKIWKTGSSTSIRCTMEYKMLLKNCVCFYCLGNERIECVNQLLCFILLWCLATSNTHSNHQRNLIQNFDYAIAWCDPMSKLLEFRTFVMLLHATSEMAPSWSRSFIYFHEKTDENGSNLNCFVKLQKWLKSVGAMKFRTNDEYIGFVNRNWGCCCPKYGVTFLVKLKLNMGAFIFIC